jgi:hypothetical protein
MRDEATDDVRLGEFVRRCGRYFTFSGGSGRLIDQPFQDRIIEGIIRCYLVNGEVVGFARQYPEQPSSDSHPSVPRRVFGLPSAKTMFPPDEPTFDSLKGAVESEWVPAMQDLVDVDSASLPALWDADFLFGLKNAAGEDTYVLCEINVSAVLPFPAEAPTQVAQATLAAVQAAQRGRPAR